MKDAKGKIRVIVVDDSALVRRLVTEILTSDAEIEVVAAAADPFAARDLIKLHNPDVITLDVEMPRMTGLAFLEKIMKLRPMPVVMVSSLTQNGADVTLEALGMGAVDFVAKPRIDMTAGLAQVGSEIIRKVKIASRARVTRRPPDPAQAAPFASAGAFATTDKLFAIGASTGGIEAIRHVLMGMPPDSPATVVTQHIPPVFSASFAARLDRETPLRAMEAKDGDRILPGHVYVAPGGRHLSVERSGSRWYARLSGEPAVNQHKPSVDVLFESVARAAGGNAVAALLTGMGADGARGLKALREAGAHTIAQDEESSVVWGMPGSAVRMGGAEQVLPLDRIAAAMLRAAHCAMSADTALQGV